MRNVMMQDVRCVRHRTLLERAVSAGCFAAVLPVATIAATTGWRWQPWPPGAAGYRSVWREARNAAQTMTEIAFSA